MNELCCTCATVQQERERSKVRAFLVMDLGNPCLPRVDQPWHGFLTNLLSPCSSPKTNHAGGTSRLTFWRCLGLGLVPVTWCLPRSGQIPVTNCRTTAGFLFTFLQSWLQCVKAGFWKGYCFSCCM